MKLLQKTILPELLSKLSQSNVVYVPKEVSGVIKFAPYAP